MKQVLIVVLLVLGLTGCGTVYKDGQKVDWENPTKEVLKDKRECRESAGIQTGGGKDTDAYYGQFYEECLNERGYKIDGLVDY